MRVSIPLIFFLIACGLSSVGPGAVSTVALIAPLADGRWANGQDCRLCCGAHGGQRRQRGEPVAILGVGKIANSAMAKAGLVGFEGTRLVRELRRARARRRQRRMVDGAAAGGARDGRLMRRPPGGDPCSTRGSADAGAHRGMDRRGARAQPRPRPVRVRRCGDHPFVQRVRRVGAMKRIPSGIIMMVSGVSMLVSLLEETGGMDLFTDLLARIASPRRLNGVIAFVTGSISTYSSTSGVVLPTFCRRPARWSRRSGAGSARRRPVHQCRVVARRRIAAVDDRRAVRRGGRGHRRGAEAVSRPARVGVAMTLVGALLCALFAPMLARR